MALADRVEQQWREQKQAAVPGSAHPELAQQLAHAARQHHQQHSPAAQGVVGCDTGRRNDEVQQPAIGPAPSTPSATQPTVQTGGFGSMGAASGAMAPAAALGRSTPMAVDAVAPTEGCRTNEAGMPVFGLTAPVYPVYTHSMTGSASAGASAPAAATHPAKFRRSDAAKAAKSKGAACDDAKVLYASRPDGSVFGMAGVPGEKWASGK